MKKIIVFASLLLAITACSFNKSSEKELPISDQIRINQLGFYPASIKQFLLVDTFATKFNIIDEEYNIVFSGGLLDNGYWEASGEKVLMGDFSILTKVGTYRVIINNEFLSFPFEIKNNLYKEALRASIKSYYFQRASFEIEEQFGGIYRRPAGHPDNSCKYHPSSGHAKGTLNSVGGWYDAGDYGKYIGNAALSTGQMLLLAEQYPNLITDNSLNIPESGNERSDLLDELKYELDWILSMQDKDGGVYHKLTAKNFSGFIMPADYDLERWIIGKGTASTLNFSAVMAQAARIFDKTDSEWSEKAISASRNAWSWAIENDNIHYVNPKDIKTGEYGDTEFKDDFFWAAAELYISTKEEIYLEYLKTNKQDYIHQLTNSWKFFVRNNAFHSLLENKELLDDDFANYFIKNHIKLANELISEINVNPYNIALNRYEWGSNSDILNQALILCIAHKITGEEKYIDAAEQINDYIFGKNATGYCFLTGFGSKKVMFVHHRPSGADGIAEPIPGFIAGGPNNDRQDADNVSYLSILPAKSYMDLEASYASNEVCLNWNAPAVYVLGYLEENR